MKVFISWSGLKSRKVASLLRQWIPEVIPAAVPWMSSRDIPAGSRWRSEIGRKLSEVDLGIICLTKTNLSAPWILFEAGALAKAIDDTSVCPYLIDLEQIPPGPLDQFQGKRAGKDGTWELICAINKALKGDPLPEKRLRKVFDRKWNDLRLALRSLPVEENTPETQLTRDLNYQAFFDLGMETIHERLTHRQLQDHLKDSGDIQVLKTWFPESNVIRKGLRLAITEQRARVRLLLCKAGSYLLAQRSEGAHKPSTRGSATVYQAVEDVYEWVKATPGADVEISLYDSWPGCPVIWYDGNILMGFYFRGDASPEWPWVRVRPKSTVAEILTDQFDELWRLSTTEHLDTPKKMAAWLKRHEKKWGDVRRKSHQRRKPKSRL